jgi:DNA-directed RNA polymerase specialized sigma subunit
VSETLTGARLKAKVLRFITDLDIEVRTTIPQRIRRDGEKELRKKLGREPSNSEITIYIYEKTQNADTSQRDKEYVEKTIKLRLANEARQTLLNNSDKDQYDGVHNQARRATCYDHNTGVYNTKADKKIEEKWFSRDDHGVRK